MAKDTEKLIRQLSLISFLMAQGRPVSALEIKREVEGYSVMNEDAFARRFYADRAELEALESVTHPAIRRVIAAEVAAATAPVVVVEVSVGADLVGPGWIRVVVDAPDAARIDRAVARGLTREQAIARMSAQPARDEWLEGADRVLRNDGDEAALEIEVAALWRWLTEGGDADDADRPPADDADPPPADYVPPDRYPDR